MRNITPSEIELAILKYNDDPKKGETGYYIHIKFKEPLELCKAMKSQEELYTLAHKTAESAIQNFENIFQNPSQAKEVKKEL